MNPYRFPVALIAFMGFALVAPGWAWFLDNYPPVGSLSAQARFLATLVLPALAALYLAGWLQPRGGR